MNTSTKAGKGPFNLFLAYGANHLALSSLDKLDVANANLAAWVNDL
jgi:hypothetical protein